MKISKIKLEESVVDYLTKSGVFNTTTSMVLNIAEKVGGYVAGGFAFELFKILSAHDFKLHAISYAEIKKHLKDDYLKTGLDLTATYESKGLSYFADIDVWFHNVTQYEEFLELTKEIVEGMSLSVVLQPSVAGHATNVFCFEGTGINGQKVQAINTYMGPIESTISRFDIHNASCAFRHDELVFFEELIDLHRRKEVALNDETFVFSNYGITRLRRWMDRHGYSKLDCAAKDCLNQKIDEYIDSLTTDHRNAVEKNMSKYLNEEYKNYVPAFKASTVMGLFLKYMTIESLLKLSLIFKNDVAGNPAMNEIMRRNNKNLNTDDSTRFNVSLSDDDVLDTILF